MKNYVAVIFTHYIPGRCNNGILIIIDENFKTVSTRAQLVHRAVICYGHKLLKWLTKDLNWGSGADVRDGHAVRHYGVGPRESNATEFFGAKNSIVTACDNEACGQD
jgi:hypothetical protein